MGVTLRQVEIFVAVAEQRHFGRAAEALHISQPTVSQEIGRLERSLGVPLFDRSRRSASLTPAGEVMASEGRELLDRATRLVRRVQLFEASRMRTVRVIASPSVVNRLLPSVISRAEKELPQVRIDESAVETGGVSSHLAADGGDIGLGRFLDNVSGFQKTKIADETVYVALSRNHPRSEDERIDLEALGDLPLLLWPREQNPAYYDYVLGICVQRDMAPMVLVSPPRIVGSRLYLLSESRAFSLIPHSIIDHLSADLRAVPLSRPATLPLEMQWRSDDPRPQVVALREIFKEEAATLSA